MKILLSYILKMGSLKICTEIFSYNLYLHFQAPVLHQKDKDIDVWQLLTD